MIMPDRPVPPSACPLCNDVRASPFFVKNGYAIVRCETCTALYVSPMPSDAELASHYQSPIYYSGEEDQGYRSYADIKKALAPHFSRRLRVIDRYLARRGRLLDFGCAAGYFLAMAQADGWQISGVELAQDMARQASNDLGILVATSLDALPKREFDAITLWEVIEHLPRPLSELRRLYDRLRPGGLLMLSTPNNGHWQAVQEPETWISYRPPSHLLYFTAHALASALQRAGFVRIEVHGASPLPRLPIWLRRATAPLYYELATGQAKAWPVALFVWRAIRVLGWGWQKAVSPHDDIFTTLEATAFRPA